MTASSGLRPTEPPHGRNPALTEKLTSSSVTRSVVFSVGSAGLILGLQLFTGVLTARLLGPEGRGEIEAVISWILIAAMIFPLGFGGGLSYLQARDKAPSGTVVGAGLAMILVSGTVGFVALQVLIPIGFAQQTDATVRLAQLLSIAIFVVIGTELVRSQLAANNFFRSASLNNLGQPLVYAVGAVGLWVFGMYSVASIAIAQFMGFALMFVIGGITLWRVSGIQRPQRAEISEAGRYGLRGLGGSLSRLANARLDMVALPAFVAAAQIGIYAIAVSVGSMIVAVFQQVERVVFTNTAKKSGAERVEFIERMIRMVSAAVLVVALVLGVVAEPLIAFVYGEAFRASAEPLRILLPGLVLWSTNSLIGAALMGAGYPGRASLAQVSGVVVTIGGLAFALPRYGIIGAAVVSSLAYATVAVTGALLLRAAAGVSLRKMASPFRLRHDVVDLVGRRMRSR